jgi:predicted phosphodiesterase
MKIAVISDIHGNIEALQSMLRMIDRRGAHAVHCLGDVVGYGGSPNECVELLRRRGIRTVAGNHDKAVLGELSVDDFSSAAKEGVLWTRNVLSDESRIFLSAMEMSFVDHDAQFVHSSPDVPEQFRYLLSLGHALESFGVMSVPICFVGHTHRPAIFCEDGTTGTVTAGVRTIVNVGSVGQPRDGDARSCCVLFDTESREVEYLRADYDIASAQRKILEAGLPPKLALRLENGI